MLAEEVGRPGQAGLQIAAVVDIARNGGGNHAVGRVALACGVGAQRSAHIAGRAAGRGQGCGFFKAGVAGGQAGAAGQGLIDELIELGIAQTCPPLGGGECRGVRSAEAGGVVQADIGRAQSCQRLVCRPLRGTACQREHGGQCCGCQQRAARGALGGGFA